MEKEIDQSPITLFPVVLPSSKCPLHFRRARQSPRKMYLVEPVDSGHACLPQVREVDQCKEVRTSSEEVWYTAQARVQIVGTVQRLPYENLTPRNQRFAGAVPA